MMNVELEQVVHASTQEVWDIVGEFGDLDQWHPLVPNCSLNDDGTIRTIDTPPTPAVERLIRENPDERWHEYTLDDGPMPIRTYRAIVGVREESDERCVLYYQAECEPDGVGEAKLRQILTSFFSAGFTAVAESFE